MLFAHWMLLVATFLPIVAISFAKASKDYDNAQPRAYVEKLGENTMQRRMVWAHDNSWEALIMFAPAVLLATIMHVAPTTLNALAGIFVAARVVYLWCYAKNLATLRSAIWFVGMACVVGLYIASAI